MEENNKVFHWQHIQFADGSNPYISKTAEDFECMKNRYSLKQLAENFWLAE